MSDALPTMAQVLADAAARRRVSTETGTSEAQFIQEHDKRQAFRRLIDPGIFRPNSREVAMDALKTLSTIAENILREPENPKYRSLKRENDMIKRRLIEPKGTLEYALALGFRPEVVEFQSHYVFNPGRMADLRIGAAMLKEALDREMEKEARGLRKGEDQKAAAAAAAQNAKLAFLDDRKTKKLRDEMERELRETREAARTAQGSGVTAAAVSSSPERDQSPISMPPGLGYTLGGVGDDPDQPPPYNG